MLYKRDYTVLTEDEQASIRKAKAFQEETNIHKDEKFGAWSSLDVAKYVSMLPEAAHYYESLFPNNYLPRFKLDTKEPLNKVLKEFGSLLDKPATGERDILNFIKQEEAYFIISSLLRSYHFGHHAAYVFKEFPLSANYVVDYLICGKNSGGHEFIFLELEAPYGNITTKDGSFGTAINKGLKQIADWDEWIDANYSGLSAGFKKYANGQDLPEEFYRLDKTRVHYAVVAGRRPDFNQKTHRLRRDKKKSNNISILHYDNLLDAAKELVKIGYY